MNNSTPSPDGPVAAGKSTKTQIPRKWVNQLAYYRGQLEASKKYLRQEGLHDEWRQWRRIYSENTKSHDPAVDRVDVPIAFANVNVLRSTLTVDNPKFAVTPRNEGSAIPAMLCEEVINYEWRRRRFQDEIRKAVDDALIIGHGWIKLGYNLRYHGSPEEVPELAPLANGNFNFGLLNQQGFSEGFDRLIESARNMGSSVPGHYGEPLTDAGEMARQLFKEGGIVLADHPLLERVSPLDMYVDPSATCLRNAQWIAQRTPVRRDVALANKAWSSARHELSAGQKSLKEGDNGTELVSGLVGFDTTTKSEQMEWVIIWELYDLHEGTWCQFSDEGSDFLTRPEPMPFQIGQPFRMITDYEIPDEFYPIGEIERIAPLQMELNNTRSSLINDRKQNKAKWIVDKRFLGDGSQEGLRHVLTSEEDNLIAAVDLNQAQAISNIVHQVPGRDLDPELYNLSAVMRSDINETTGISEYQRGGGGGTGASTATEAAIINDGALARLKEKQGKVEKLMAEAAEGIVGLMLQYMSAKKTIRVVAGGGNSRFSEAARKYMGVDLSQVDEIFQSYSREDLAGQYDLIIEPGSSSAFNESQRRRAANETFAALLPLFGQGMVNEQEVLAYYLRYGLGIPNVERFFPAPAPQGPQGGVPYDPTAPQGGAQGAGQLGLGGVPTTAEGQLAPGGGIPQSAIAPTPAL